MAKKELLVGVISQYMYVNN